MSTFTFLWKCFCDHSFIMICTLNVELNQRQIPIACEYIQIQIIDFKCSANDTMTCYYWTDYYAECKNSKKNITLSHDSVAKTYSLKICIQNVTFPFRCVRFVCVNLYLATFLCTYFIHTVHIL